MKRYPVRIGSPGWHHAMNLIILALGFSYTIFAFISILWQEQLAAQKAFFSAAQIHAAEVSQGFAQSLQLVRSANAYFRASRHVSRKDFQVFTQPLLSHYHGIQGLAWVPRVSEEQRSKYEKKARSEFPGFHFTERHEADILVPAGQRPEYFPIYYVEPCKRNEKALGYDLGSDSAWRHAIRQAEEKKDIVSSPGVRFVPDGAGRSGLLLFDPVYRDMLGKTATLAGFVVGEFHIGDIVENAIRHAKPLGLDFTLYEGPESLYTHLSRVSSKPREKAAGLNYTARLEVGGRYWTMKLSPAPGRFDTAPEPHAWGVLFAGTAITLALAAYLQIAFSRSASLAEKEGVLSRSQEAAHLGNWEWKIRENRLTWSDETHRIFGIPQRDFDATFEAFLKSVHPDDRPLVRHGFDEALVRNAPFSLNHRIILPDGTVRFVHEQGEMESDTSGRPVRLFGIVQDVTEKRKAEERIEFLAYYDALTGLPNRILLHDRIEVALANARRRNDKVALLFLDLDHFKTINDSLGHSIGDLLLKEVSERLKRWIREQDSIARLGGDEFLVLMPDIRHLQDAAVTAERIVKSMAAGFAIQDHAITVTCSIGISVFPEHGADAETLIKHADTAMYHAKESGRNNFEFFTPEMSIRAMQLMALENSLRLALEKKELFMVYQPQFNILSGKMTGCEALIRWNHPDMGLVPPEKFVPVAENSGLIVPIGEWCSRPSAARCVDGRTRDWHFLP